MIGELILQKMYLDYESIFLLFSLEDKFIMVFKHEELRKKEVIKQKSL